jgi:hypothetical protein
MFQEEMVMAKVQQELYIDDITCSVDHQLELSASVNQSWIDEDGRELDGMTICLHADLSEAMEAMFLVADSDVMTLPIDEIEESIHILHVLEQQVSELRERLFNQLKKRMERN